MYRLNKFTLPIALAVIGLGVVLATIFLSHNSAEAFAEPTATATAAVHPAGAMPTPTIASAVTPAAARKISGKTKLVGNLVSANQVTLAFQIGGRVKDLPAPEGTRVQAGALLAALDTTLLEFQVAQAKAALDLANANWNRLKAGPTADEIAAARSGLDRAKAALEQAQAAYDRAGGQGNAYISMLPQSALLQQATLAYQAAEAQYRLAVNHPTPAEREIGLAQVAQAQAAYELARQNLTNARIVAPFDGTVVWVGPKLGETATPIAPAIILADLTQMQVQLVVDENTLANIRVGQPATIVVDAAPNATLTGRVKKIGLLATTIGGVASVPVTIDLDRADAPIYPGLSATVEIATSP